MERKLLLWVKILKFGVYYIQELRKHKRLSITVKTEITLPDGSVCQGESKNIGFGGMFIKTDDLTEITRDMECDASLILHESISIRLRCRVIHIQDDGVGFNFISINVLDYEHFKNLMVANSPDPEKLLEEEEQHPGLVIER